MLSCSSLRAHPFLACILDSSCLLGFSMLLLLLPLLAPLWACCCNCTCSCCSGGSRPIAGTRRTPIASCGLSGANSRAVARKKASARCASEVVGQGAHQFHGLGQLHMRNKTNACQGVVTLLSGCSHSTAQPGSLQ